MADTSSMDELHKLLADLEQHGHAAHAVLVASILESRLATLLAAYMPNLSNRMQEKLFSGYGPLSSFSAKIDLAYALDLIPESLRRDLHVIREIRNEFAHSTVSIHFGSEPIKTMLLKFPDYKATTETKAVAFLINKMGECLDVIRPGIYTLTMAKALHPTVAERLASPDKSTEPTPRRPRRSPGGSGKGGKAPPRSSRA